MYQITSDNKVSIHTWTMPLTPFVWNGMKRFSVRFFLCVTTAKWLFPCQLIEVEKNGRQYVMIGSDNGSVPWWSTIIWNNDNLAYWCTHGWLGVKRERGSPWDPNWPADSILKRYSEPCTTLTNGNHEVARQPRFPQRVWYIKWQYIYLPIGENWYQLDLD